MPRTIPSWALAGLPAGATDPDRGGTHNRDRTPKFDLVDKIATVSRADLRERCGHITDAEVIGRDVGLAGQWWGVWPWAR